MHSARVSLCGCTNPALALPTTTNPDLPNFKLPFPFNYVENEFATGGNGPGGMESDFGVVLEKGRSSLFVPKP